MLWSSCSTAKDGEEALGLVRRLRPDLVLADVMMPRLDGRALLQAIRADDDHRSTPSSRSSIASCARMARWPGPCPGPCRCSTTEARSSSGSAPPRRCPAAPTSSPPVRRPRTERLCW
ncbi:MAG TPA: response regulator [Streptosporangiaceae bacterium]|nr:response regulator [Streptosporangiaceae bacterium]